MEYDKYRFTERDIELSLFNKLGNVMIAARERRGFFRKFCAANGIDLPISSERKYKLPKEYCVENLRIEFLAKIRDRAILDAYKIYMRKNDILQNELVRVADLVQNREDFIDSKMRELTEIESSLKTAKQEPAMILYMQHNRAELSTLIANQKQYLEDLKTRQDALKRVNQRNGQLWKKQIDDIDSKIENETIKFIKRLGRKVTKKLDFTDYVYVKPEFSARVRSLLGEGAKAQK